MIFTRIYIFIITFCLLLSPEIHAKTNKAKATKTRITSKFIDIKRKTQQITFIDDVVVKSGEDMMTSDTMVVFYKEKGGANDIEKINASGNVKVFGSDFVATSDLGHYNPNEETFVLEENVVVNNNDSIGTGNKFIYSLKTRKGSFVGKSQKMQTQKDERVIVIIGKNATKNKKNNDKNTKR